MGWMNCGTPGCAAQTPRIRLSRQSAEQRRVRQESSMGNQAGSEKGFADTANLPCATTIYEAISRGAGAAETSIFIGIACGVRPQQPSDSPESGEALTHVRVRGVAEC